MAEDAYRAELIHAWRMKRLNDALVDVRQETIILEHDIQWIESIQEALNHE